ncbi:hypothetical protein KM043_018531 [Ampulex compressa]|nr:hypothetical protein KM043_018531 [Ampulex compressa]
MRDPRANGSTRNFSGKRGRQVSGSEHARRGYPLHLHTFLHTPQGSRAISPSANVTELGIVLFSSSFQKFQSNPHRAQ